jgi:hypothetical protein
VSASWSTVEALQDDPALLAEVEAAFAEQDELRAEREAILSEGAGCVRGEAPHFSCLRTDNWISGNGGVPHAVIPPVEQAELNENEQRESFDAGGDGMPLRRGALHALPKIVRTAEGELERLGDGRGENQEQARALYELGRESKAQRLACCARFARRIECAGGHSFRQTFRCGLRFCRACAPQVFQELFAKYVGLERLVQKRPHWVLARLDFTVRNTGKMPTADAIRAMNLAVRKTLKRLLKGKKGWGYLWCDEFGFENTNLHCHGLYYGPYLPHNQVLDAWEKETKDSLRASIQSARGDFRKALYHLLKYVSKPPGDDPRHLAQLEAAFSGVRRVHTLGLFYNPDLHEEDDPKELKCPHCDGHLFVVGAYCSIGDLESSGLRDIETVRRETRRQRVFGRAGPP